MSEYDFMSPQETWKAYSELRSRVATDAQFRARALGDPNGVLSELLGRPLPEGFKVNLADNKGADLSIVLPDLVVQGAEELTDADLESVAGGRCAASCAASCAVTSTASVGVPMVGGAACL